MSDNKKTSKFSKIVNGVKMLPNPAKWGIIGAVAVVLFVSGILFNSASSSQVKTTKLGLQDVGELVTQTAYLTIVRDTEEHKEFFNMFKLPFTQSRQIFSYDLEVDASVDFSKISYTPNKDKSEITIKLPHAKIYKVTLKTDSLVVYLDTESIFSRIDLNEQNDALKAMEEQAVKDAEANGILEAADTNAKRLIEGMVKGNAGYKDWNIVYEYIGE